jgi:hypothetical protein
LNLIGIAKQMITRLLILLIIIFAGLHSTGQISLATKVFHKHLQTCHVVGTTEEDFVVELFSDSTIKISIYQSDYRDRYTSILRDNYFGKYILCGDTMKIKYLSINSEVKSKIKKQTTNSLYIKPVKSLVFYPTTIFLFGDNFIQATDQLLPRLSLSTFILANQLDYKFCNWDKRPSNIIEVFGVTNNQ